MMTGAKGFSHEVLRPSFTEHASRTDAPVAAESSEARGTPLIVINCGPLITDFGLSVIASLAVSACDTRRAAFGLGFVSFLTDCSSSAYSLVEIQPSNSRLLLALQLSLRSQVSPRVSCRLLPERLPKEPVRLVTLSFLMTDEARTKCSLRVLPAMLGNGKTSLLQISDISPSSRARSARDGVRTGSRLFVRRDWDRLMARPEVDVPAPSLATLVFFRTTWHSGVLEPTVVAR